MATDMTTAEAEESTAADHVAAAAAEEIARVEGVRSARGHVSHGDEDTALELVVSPHRRAELDDVTTACDQVAAAVGPFAEREGLRLRCVVRRPSPAGAWRALVSRMQTAPHRHPNSPGAPTPRHAGRVRPTTT
jgi:hypothetical protein